MDSFTQFIEWGVVYCPTSDTVAVMSNIGVPRLHPNRPNDHVQLLFPIVHVRGAGTQPPIYGPDKGYIPRTRINGVPGPYYEASHYLGPRTTSVYGPVPISAAPYGTRLDGSARKKPGRKPGKKIVKKTGAGQQPTGPRRRQ